MDSRFETPDGVPVTAVTADEMAEIDRIAVEDVGLGLLQMMENAGRTLAGTVIDRFDPDRVAVLAGGGGNGGGGLCAGRHLANRGVELSVSLDRDPGDLTGAAGRQCRILRAMGVRPGPVEIREIGDVVVDALVGYGLSGPVEGRTRQLIESVANQEPPVVSLDVPSGVDATTGVAAGPAVNPTVTVTLALPKTGLGSTTGRLVLGDIGIPTTVFERAGIQYRSPFAGADRVRLRRV